MGRKSRENKRMERQNSLQSFDIDNLTDMSEVNSSKFEQEKDRNALLKAHLDDMKKRAKKAAKTKKKKSSNDKKSNKVSMNTSSGSNAIGDISDSFEYIANNFANLVLKKHEAESKLAPQQAKVSQLKKKCAERDLLLSKMMLKLKKREKLTSSQGSVTSSNKTNNLLKKGEKIIKDEKDSDSSIPDAITNGFYSPKRPSPTLMKALNKSALVEGKPRTKHKMFVAKRDFVPTHENRKHDVTTGSNHEFLPYLPLKAGETLVGIGNPEKKENGKMYQLAEVRGKIGWVPQSHIIAGENVNGMKEFLKDKPEKTDK